MIPPIAVKATKLSVLQRPRAVAVTTRNYVNLRIVLGHYNAAPCAELRLLARPNRGTSSRLDASSRAGGRRSRGCSRAALEDPTHRTFPVFSCLGLQCSSPWQRQRVQPKRANQRQQQVWDAGVHQSAARS